MVWKLAKSSRDAAIDLAASELKKYLERIDPTVEVAILSVPGWTAELTDVLWLDVCPEVSALVKDPLYDDAIRIDVRGGRGGIYGANPRSVLLGAYRFLRELGCAWVRPGSNGEIIPARSLADIAVSLTEVPSCRHRAVCIEGAVSYDHVADMISWLPKIGMNGYFNQFNSPFTFYDRWYSHMENPLFEDERLSVAEIRGLRDQSIEEMKKRGLMYHAAGHGWTCEPFGIPGETWDTRTYDITDEQRAFMAEVNGKRDLWRGVPLNTNLCYSNPEVRGRIADAIAETCKNTPAIDFIQLWLADGTNNHCECAECVKKLPSDWYVQLLNEVDAKLTAEGLPQKVVFLIYVDLLWAPEREKFNNPDRFVLMFAPITRTYSASMADCEHFDEQNLPAYERNKLKFPRSVGENLAWLLKWQKVFPGDSFDFDYHYMWDHFKDPGYYTMAKILFRDMANLHKVSLNGMVSCQNQRVFFPNGLGMTAMAAALWDEHADFDSVADDYFDAAYGEDAPVAQEYLQKLSEAFDPPYLRGEKPWVDDAQALKFAGIQGILNEYAEIITENADDETLPENIRASWVYLEYHAELCALLARALYLKASGQREKALTVLEDVRAWARQNERDLAAVFDVFEFNRTIASVLKAE